MVFVTGETRQQWTIRRILEEKPEEEIEIRGAVQNVRDMGDFAFVLLRRFDGTLQCVDEKKQVEIPEGASVSVIGRISWDERAPHGFEIRAEEIRLLSIPEEKPAVPIHKARIHLNVESDLNLRPLTLRNLRKRAVFKLQEGIVRGFREYLQSRDFTEIHTPKIVAAGAEGGSNIFKLDYFGHKAFLAQSPQFYKQTMVGVFDRVFEVGPVFRAEKHATTRHLNEYTSMDFEMGYIDSYEEIMQTETALLKFTMELLKRDYSAQIALLEVRVPEITSIPAVPFAQAKEMISKKYNRKIREPYYLEPEEEQLISRFFREECGSDFVFVTHYPSKKRPFYAMDDPDDPKRTLSFDLLFRGIEVTTGGQRIHSYREQVAKMERLGLDPADFESYLMAHKYGLPPHGGLGIGLERLTMCLIGESNIREASLFPRDITRLQP